MRCGQQKRFASAYLDGQLTLHEAVMYHQHCEACAACRIYLAELQQVSLMLKSTFQPESPLQLRREVMAAIAAG